MTNLNISHRLEALKQQGEDIPWDPSKPFKLYCNSCKTVYTEGKKRYMLKDYENAYIYYWRYLNLLTEYLPKHPQYAENKIQNELLTELKSYFKETADIIKQIKRLLIEQYEHESQNIPDLTELAVSRKLSESKMEENIDTSSLEHSVLKNSSSSGFIEPHSLLQLLDCMKEGASNLILYIDLRDQQAQDCKEMPSGGPIIKLSRDILSDSTTIAIHLENYIQSDAEKEYFRHRDAYELIIYFDEDSSKLDSIHKELVRVIYDMEFKTIPKRRPVLLKGGIKALLSNPHKEKLIVPINEAIEKMERNVLVNVSSPCTTYDEKAISYPKLNLSSGPLVSSSDMSLKKSGSLYPDLSKAFENDIRPILFPKPRFMKKNETTTSSSRPGLFVPVRSPLASLTAVTSSQATPLPSVPTKPVPININSDPFSYFEASLIPSFSNQGIGSNIGTVGLKNLGNTCFMNSILQCLSATFSLSRYFLSGAYKKHINKTRGLETRGEFADVFADFLRAVWSGEYTVISPILLRETVVKVAKRFDGNDQQDAQEFMSLFLDHLHEDLNWARRDASIVKPHVSDLISRGNLEWQTYLNSHFSIIVGLFQGQLLSTIECIICGYISNSFDVFMYLSLPLMKNVSRMSLKQCLELFVKEERLSNENAWFCPNCKCKREAKKKLEIWRLPEYLIIHFVRFSFEGPFRDKLETVIDYPIFGFDLSLYIKNGKASDMEYRYDLYSVTLHYGGMNGGHYKAFCLLEPHQAWYSFDDSRVASLPYFNIMDKAAYILFYKRRKQPV